MFFIQNDFISLNLVIRIFSVILIGSYRIAGWLINNLDGSKSLTWRLQVLLVLNEHDFGTVNVLIINLKVSNIFHI